MIKVQNNYYRMIDTVANIDNMIGKLEQQRMHLKHTYEQLVSENSTINVITTDTFAFQNNLFELKLDNSKQLYRKITVQIYGDYYKLIKYITNYVNTYIEISETFDIDDRIISTTKLVDKIVPYKINTITDSRYNLKNAKTIYNYIIDILEVLNNYYKKNNEKYRSINRELNFGINIENYIYNIKYNNDSLKHNIELFTTFLNRFNEYHIKYLSNVEYDLKILYQTINQEIKFSTIDIYNDTYKESLDSSNNIVITKNRSITYTCKKYFYISIKYLKYIIKLNIFIIVSIMIYQTKNFI